MSHPPSPGPVPPYGAGPWPAPAVPPKHPSATTALTLGLIAVVGGLACGLPLVLGPWAWTTGSRVVAEIDASGGTLGGRGEAQAGYVMGIVATVLLGVGLVVLLVYAVVVIGMLGVFFSAVGS